jgi:hypothetical protein
VHAQRLLNLPPALQRRRTLPLVARYGDACSLRPTPEIPHKLDVLRRQCDSAGTDFDRIDRTCAYAFQVDDELPTRSEQ